MTGYVIVRCPRCGHFTYSRVGTKARQCPYCGKVFKLTLDRRIKEVARIHDAKAIVQYLNKKEILSRAKKKKQVIIEGKKRLTHLHKLRKEIVTLLKKQSNELGDIDLNKFVEIVESEGIPWDEASLILENLNEEGYIIFPEPDKIRIVNSICDKRVSSCSMQKLLKYIEALFIEAEDNELTYDTLLKRILEIGCSEIDLKRAIEILSNNGYIYEPKPQTYRIVKRK
ncbi:MAG: DUF1922 domain-containing protein [Candidatus Odinarchaeota archaeon]|nr:DUF1922 domain-containing protein [Candidatus Odinarchaeota archaeon]